MRRRTLFFLLLIVVGTLAFGANAFAAGLTYTNSGVLEYWADDVNDTSLNNTITVEPAETAGFQSWVKITYDYWNTGPVYGDASLTNNCILEINFWACPASKVWVRTSKGDDSITVKPGVTAWVLAEGGGGNDTITGGNEKDEFWGACKFAPADQCYGFGDTLNGGGGEDFLVGGSTTPVFGKAADVLHGGAGDDVLEGAAGADQLWGDGGTGHGHVRVPRRARHRVARRHCQRRRDGRERLHPHRRRGDRGRPEQGQPDGNDGDNTLKGGPGDDNLFGFGGSDKLYGEDGNDLLRPGLGADFLYGGDDGNSCCWNDTVSYSERGGPVNVSLDGNANDGEPGEGDYIDDDVESLVGGNDNDVLIGSGRGNTLTGNGGQDTLIGLGSPLPQSPQAGSHVADKLIGGAGDDTLNGGPRAASSTPSTAARALTPSPTHRAPTTSRSSSTRRSARARTTSPGSRTSSPATETTRSWATTAGT